MDEQVEFRITLASRLFVIGWVAWLMALDLLIAMVGLQHGSFEGLLAVLGFGAVFIAAALRFNRIVVFTTADDLVYRNFFWSGRVPKRRIREFRVGGSRLEGLGKAVRAVLLDGTTVVLHGTARRVVTDEELEGYAAALNRWVRTGRWADPA